MSFLWQFIAHSLIAGDTVKLVNIFVIFLELFTLNETFRFRRIFVFPHDVDDVACDDILSRGGRNQMCKWRQDFDNRLYCNFSLQHSPHKLHPALAWFTALIFLNSIGFLYGIYFVPLILIVVEGYILITLYSMMEKFKSEWAEMKLHFGEVWRFKAKENPSGKSMKSGVKCVIVWHLSKPS